MPADRLDELLGKVKAHVQLGASVSGVTRREALIALDEIAASRASTGTDPGFTKRDPALALDPKTGDYVWCRCGDAIRTDDAVCGNCHAPALMARSSSTVRCEGRCHCHAGADGVMHPPCCEDCAPPARAERAPCNGFTARRLAEMVRKRHADHEDRCLWCGKPWPCVDYCDADDFLNQPSAESDPGATDERKAGIELAALILEAAPEPWGMTAATRVRSLLFVYPGPDPRESEPEAPREVYFARWLASRPCECKPGQPPCFPCGARALSSQGYATGGKGDAT
jgi:hypothetical protein